MTIGHIDATDAELSRQINALITTNEALTRDLEQARIAADSLERQLEQSQDAREAIQQRVRDLALRVTQLHADIYPTLDALRGEWRKALAAIDRLSNHQQGLVTRAELDERDARIVRLCKQEQA